MLASSPQQARLRDRLAAQLSRVTSGGELIPEIDGLRFLAIALVIFHHMTSIYLPASRRATQINSPDEWFAAARGSWLIVIGYCGHFGVNLFFAISGFILALPFAKRAFEQKPAPSLKNYYLRRVTRIEPPYVICLALFFIGLVAWAIWTRRPGTIPNLFQHLLASLFYSHNLLFGEHSRINSVTWSLEIEIQFYLLVPLLVAIFKLKDKRVRRALLLSLILLGGWLSQYVIYRSSSTRLQLSLLNFFHYFLVGFLLADLYLTGWLRGRKGWRFDVCSLGGLLALAGLLTRYDRYYWLLPLAVLLLYVGCFRGVASNWLVRLRWIVITGGMCYTFYLYHIPLVSLLTLLMKRGFSPAAPLWLDLLKQTLIVCPIVFALCSFWFVLTEKPFMRWSLAPRGRDTEPRQTQPGDNVVLEDTAIQSTLPPGADAISLVIK